MFSINLKTHFNVIEGWIFLKHRKEENDSMSKPESGMKWAWTIVKNMWVLPVMGFFLVDGLKLDFNQLGPFGDFIAGTIVPVLTFASFLMVVATLGLQREQLEIQSRELRNSIEEMQSTRKEFEEQNETMAVQRFENTFFQMVNLHNQIVSSMHVGGQNAKTGKNAFYFLYRTLKSTVYGSNIKELRENYEEYYNTYENQLGHYFRNLYRIIKFIDETSILRYEDKKTYIGIIKAQLSSSELALLLYNGLSVNGTKFLPLMHEYNLLDNLNHEYLIKAAHYKLFQDLKV
jgi:hypothetical protein